MVAVGECAQIAQETHITDLVLEQTDRWGGLARSFNAILTARPVDPARIISAPEFVTAGRKFLGIEEFLESRCPCCGAERRRAIRGMHDDAIGRASRGTSTSPRCTRPHAP